MIIKGKDAAGIAMEAINHAKEAKYDVVLVDTAGRMQDNEPLMRALTKVIIFIYTIIAWWSKFNKKTHYLYGTFVSTLKKKNFKILFDQISFDLLLVCYSDQLYTIRPLLKSNKLQSAQTHPPFNSNIFSDVKIWYFIYFMYYISCYTCINFL